MVTKYSVAMGLTAVANPDLQIRGGGGGHPDPYIRGRAVLVFFFALSGLSLVQKKRGGPGPPGPVPGSASELPTKSENGIQILSLFKSYETVEENRTTLSRPLSRWTVMAIQK